MHAHTYLNDCATHAQTHSLPCKPARTHTLGSPSWHSQSVIAENLEDLAFESGGSRQYSELSKVWANQHWQWQTACNDRHFSFPLTYFTVEDILLCFVWRHGKGSLSWLTGINCSSPPWEALKSEWKNNFRLYNQICFLLSQQVNTMTI